jgi:glycolate oxidase iron-sulfur subunit
MSPSNQISHLERLCLRCGKCRSVCPSFRVRRDEVFSPRGRIAQTAAVEHGTLPDDPAYAGALEECLECAACTAICPSGAAAERIANLAYQKLVAHTGLSLPKRLLLRGLLRRGRLLGSAAEWLSRLWVLTGQDRPSTLGKLLPLPRIVSKRHLPRPAARSFYRGLPASLPPIGHPKAGTVVFFPGCGLRLVYPHSGLNAVHLLQHAGYEVLLPRLETCCGRVALAHGDSNTFRYLSSQLSSQLRNLKLPIVTACASCAYTISRTYREHDIAGVPEVRMLSQVLAESDIAWRANPVVSLPVTWHDPCHLFHGLGVKEEPRSILRAAFGGDYHEAEEPGACCGGAGSYHLSHYDVSRELGMQRETQLTATGARTVITECPACIMFLREIALVTNSPWRVAHLADALLPPR